MPNYYMYKGSTGVGLVVSRDVERVPKPHAGVWVYWGDIELTPGGAGAIDKPHDEVIAAIAANGYYQAKKA